MELFLGLLFMFFVIMSFVNAEKKKWKNVADFFGWTQESSFFITGSYQGRKVVLHRKRYEQTLLSELFLDSPKNWPHGVMISRKDPTGTYIDENNYRHERFSTGDARFDRVYDVYGQKISPKVRKYFFQMGNLRFVSFSETGIKFVFIQGRFVNGSAPKPGVIAQLLALRGIRRILFTPILIATTRLHRSSNRNLWLFAGPTFAQHVPSNS